MKTVIISGGSSGIGLACIQKFLNQNYFVYNFDIVENQSVHHDAYKWIEVDVKNKTQIHSAVEEVLQENKTIDVLVVSAGKHLSANIENTSDQDLIDIIQLNLIGAFWLIQQIIPVMKSHHSGNIITIGSDQSTVAKYNSSAYGMTKSALASLTKSIALDYAQYNIRANCILAGTIDTPLYRKAIENYSIKSGIALVEIEKAENSEQPVGRIGQPDEVAELVYFLAQDTSAFITGALIPMDGGYTTQ